MSNYSNIDNTAKETLLTSLAKLSWEEVHKFWMDSQITDQREEAKREYLAAGFFIDKQYDFKLNNSEKIKLLLKGQNTVVDGFYYYQDIAAIRRKEMIAKEKVIQELKSHLNNISHQVQ